MRNILYLSILVMLMSGPVLADQDPQPCRGTIDFTSKKNFQKSLEATLWTMRTSVWNGYIDFLRGGKYWTRWGYGTWTVSEVGHIHMANDYDSYSFDIQFDQDGYQGVRSIDGIFVNGTLICGKYEADLVIGDSLEEREIRKIYLEVHGREPDPEGFRYWLKQYRSGAYTLEQIRQAAYNFPEYHTKYSDKNEHPRNE